MSGRQPFTNSLKTGNVLVAKCTKCNAMHLATVTFCNKCGSRKFSIEEKKAYGVVTTYTIITVAPEGFEELTPYAWVVMSIDETNLHISGFMAGIATPDKLLVGARVKVTGFDKRGVIIESY